MDDFTGKVVLVTGAGSGLGAQVALAFSSLGALVAANDINPINLDAVVSQVRQWGGRTGAYVFDIAKRMPIEGMLAQVLQDFGRIDILVNHAAVQPHAALLDMDEWDFHRTLDVNLGGPFFCMQQVGRIMRRLGGGVMVNLLSTLGQAAAQEGHTAHFASQAGLAGLSQAAAPELSAHNIRVNAVCRCAGAIGLISPDGLDMRVYQRWKGSLPPDPLGALPDLASLVLFLCSPAAVSITGQLIFIG